MIISSKDYKNPNLLLKQFKNQPVDYWQKKGEVRILHLFNEMAERVPAYKDFLKKNNIKASSITTTNDLKNVPTVDKDNYLKMYPLEALCWDGKFSNKRWTFSTTSGSTGEPFYFPRETEQDLQYALLAELYLRENFEIHKKSTLYINGFAMGAWIGGLFTYQAIKYLASRGDYKLSIISPGIFKKEIIKAVKNLGDKFDQIIIGGYPPLIKDTIDEGKETGLNWKRYNLGFIFSAESFTEGFRDHIISETGLKNIYTSTLNHYGTVDMGTMAHETPLSILIRRLSEQNVQIKKQLFPETHKQPTLAQYIPELFYFEEQDHNLYCSAFSGIPLIRYDLKDYGGILDIKHIKNVFLNSGLDLEKEIKSVGLDTIVWNLPFVYIYERLDFTVKLYGANIYADTIRRALQEKVFANFITGKFTMLVNFDSKQNQYLDIHIEKKPNVKETDELEKKIQQTIVNYLLKENSEYKSNYKELPKNQIPKISFWTYEHELHFSPKGKQRWVKKN